NQRHQIAVVEFRDRPGENLVAFRHDALPSPTVDGEASTSQSGQRLQMTDRAARRDGLRRGDDGIRVDAVVPVEVGERAGLAEMLDAERARAMAGDRTEPGERRRMAVEHR